MNIENLDISPELREKARACKTPEDILALAKKTNLAVGCLTLTRVLER